MADHLHKNPNEGYVFRPADVRLYPVAHGEHVSRPTIKSPSQSVLMFRSISIGSP